MERSGRRREEAERDGFVLFWFFLCQCSRSRPRRTLPPHKLQADPRHSPRSPPPPTPPSLNNAPTSPYPPSLPIQTPNQSEIDRARLHSLNLATSDLASISDLSRPIFYPSTPTFSRTISFSTSFGYLSPEDARLALLQPSPFVDDEKMQEIYEAFLCAQCGERNDWYEVLLGQVVEFSGNNERFMEEVVRGGKEDRWRAD